MKMKKKTHTHTLKLEIPSFPDAPSILGTTLDSEEMTPYVVHIQKEFTDSFGNFGSWLTVNDENEVTDSVHRTYGYAMRASIMQRAATMLQRIGDEY